MSNFNCPKCGAQCTDTEHGYITGCEHYPADLPFSKNAMLRKPIDETKHKASSDPEEILQSQCEEILRIKKVQYIHIPNALFRLKISWINKLFKGLPDLIIFDRGEKFDRVLFVELKRDIGKATGGQKTFARYFHVYIKRSVEDFVELLEEFLM